MSKRTRPKADYAAKGDRSEKIRGRVVFFTASGRPYVGVRRRQGATKRWRYGRVFKCKRCGKRTFALAQSRSDYCTSSCAYKQPRKKRRKGSTVRADYLWSQIIRSGGQCVNCGATSSLQAAHGFSRTYRKIRWSLDNGFCLCAACHLFYTHRPLHWEVWLRARWGDEKYEEMRAEALDTTRKVDLPEVLYQLNNALKQLDVVLPRWKAKEAAA